MKSRGRLDTSADNASSKKFDLNVETILENWSAYHAIREVIANAIDEQILTNTKDIEIAKDEVGSWKVRDYGRGLRYDHLTQKENEEKLRNPHVIGKFGIGLKDALATFERKGIRVQIKSRHGDITIGKSEKHGFEDILTLHAFVSRASEPRFVGTEFVMRGVTDNDITKAKDLFLRFSGETEIENTKYGAVLGRKSAIARIYINGVRVAEEENFLFSYNITSLTDSIKKALNRERTNVGRTAYSDRVKSMLLSCSSKDVASLLVDDLKNFSLGKIHDELGWIDVQEHAVRIRNASGRAIFLTPDELISAANMVDEAKNAGYEIITIPSSLKDRVRGLRDLAGNPIRELDEFYKEYNESFEFKFVSPKDLTSSEKEVFQTTDEIFKLVGGKPLAVKAVKISETMRREQGTFVEAEGLWERSSQSIIIKRSVLNTRDKYAGTLLHEVAHAATDAPDVDREFEMELTRLLGLTSAKALE